MNFDPDAAGANAAERSIGLLLDEGMQVRIVELDGGLDPDEYCKQSGAAAYEERLDAAKGYFYWLADRARAQHDVHSSEGAAAVLQSLLPAVAADFRSGSSAAPWPTTWRPTSARSAARCSTFSQSRGGARDQTDRGAQGRAAADERMLLNAVLQPEMRGRDAGGTSLARCRRRASRRGASFRRCLLLEDAGTAWGFEELHARLEPADQNLLAEAVLQEDERNTLEKARAAIESVARDERLWRRDQLKARIREAERAGNMEEAIRLARELADLERAA